jgi:myosin heavy subunit
LLELVAGILHLGNIHFESTGDRACEVTNEDALQKTAALLQVEPSDLQHAVVARIMVIRGQAPMSISLSDREASDMRDAVAKFIYARMFDWLVTRINSAIAGEQHGVNTKLKFIGILDIFGFEIFESNSLEQLFINFANEKLQQQFNHHTFKSEEQTYISEQIHFEKVSYIDNQPVLDLIEAKPVGLLALLDEELKMPNSSSKTYVAKLHIKFAPNKSYDKVRANPEFFMVKHYAGNVSYDSIGFLEKNKDTISDDLVSLFSKSRMTFLKDLFPSESSGAPGSNAMKVTVSTQFQRQLTDLMSTLNATQPHYIRCIKPNQSKVPDDFIPSMVLEQLRYSGVFEAVKIRKSGFTFRYSHENFFKKFRACAPDLIKTTARNPAAYKEACRTLVQRMGLDTDQIQIGVTRVLYRATQNRILELKRNLAIEKTVTFLQSVVRRWHARRLKKQLKRVRPILQKALQARTLAALDAALSEAGKVKFPLHELTMARTLRATLMEEERLAKVFAELTNQDAEEQYEEFHRALDAADAIKYSTSLVEQCRNKWKKIADRRQCREALQKATSESDENELTAQLARARSLDMKHDAIQAAAEAELKRCSEERRLKEALQAATSSGCWLKEGDHVDTTTLQNAIRNASSFGFKLAASKPELAWAEFLFRVRSALVPALQSPKDRALWKAVDAVLGAGGSEGSLGDRIAASAELQAIASEVALRSDMDEINTKLGQCAQPPRDEDGMRHSLDQARRLRMQDHMWENVPLARQLLHRCEQARQLLTEALQSVAETQLAYAVAFCDALQYNTPEVERARTLYLEIAEINLQAPVVRQRLEPEEMKTLLARADAVRFKSEDLEHLRTLLQRTAADKFLQLQLKAANALKDSVRSRRLTIAIKEAQLKSQADAFQVCYSFSL